jgi:antitoxin (DNA-binding transcriptional repressor) of toxin-antitoxin stability system
MTVKVGVHEAKTTLSKLLVAAEAGEEVIILRGDHPAVKLVPVGDRDWGRYEGALRVPGEFDTPDPELEALFEDAPIDPAASG